jgi:hypothetical protein
MLEIRVDMLGDTRMVNLEGDLTIEHAAELLGVFTAPRGNVKHLVLSVKKATAVDISCLQIFCSAHRTYSRERIMVSIDGRKSDEFRKMIADAGFSRHAGCGLSDGNKCLWMEESDE